MDPVERATLDLREAIKTRDGMMPGSDMQKAADRLVEFAEDRLVKMMFMSRPRNAIE